MAEDHWHAAFGVWLCDRYVGELIDRHGDQAGIHTHEDGLIHIHPSREETAGPNAVLARFLAEVDLDLNDERLVLPDGTARSNGDQCSSGPGRLAVYQWAPSPAGDATAEVVTTDLDQVLLRDNHALALVFAPEDADIPPPPSVYALDTVGDIEPPAPNQASPEPAPGGGATRGPLPNRVAETADTVKTADVDTQRPALPVGGRESFAIWNVALLAPAIDGACAAPAVASWPAGAGLGCYTPVPNGHRMGAESLASARAVPNRNSKNWSVEVTLTVDGLTQFNRLAAEAFATNQPIAIEFAGTVLAAPTVQIERFPEREILISGQFDRTSAMRLAQTLDQE